MVMAAASVTMVSSRFIMGCVFIGSFTETFLTIKIVLFS